VLRSARIVVDGPAGGRSPAGGFPSLVRGRGFARGGGESRSVRLRVAAVALWILLAAACVWAFGVTAEALVNVLGCAVVVAVTVTDLERRIVPNRIVVPALAVALVVQTARDPGVEWIVSALAAGGFFLLLALVNPAGLGMGDVKLAAFLGAWLGYDVAVALFVGSLLGVLPAIVILARRGSAGRTTTLPYVPALAAGAVVGLFLGDTLLDAWLG
jgi:leader peptidase (prepilin peptidase)/N-methyltransferase